MKLTGLLAASVAALALLGVAHAASDQKILMIDDNYPALGDTERTITPLSALPGDVHHTMMTLGFDTVRTTIGADFAMTDNQRLVLASNLNDDQIEGMRAKFGGTAIDSDTAKKLAVGYLDKASRDDLTEIKRQKFAGFLVDKDQVRAMKTVIDEIGDFVIVEIGHTPASSLNLGAAAPESVESDA